MGTSPLILFKKRQVALPVLLKLLKLKKDPLRTGFEPVRVTPSDFESDALTTRPSQRTSFL
jgi:hypothetical protein